MPSGELLAKYADVAIRVGTGLQEGDRLLVRSSVEALDLTRLLVEKAYAAGAANVDVLWSDDQIGRARFSHGSADASAVVSSASEYFKRSYELGDLLLSVAASDPNALAGQDVERIAEFQKVNSKFLEPVFESMGKLAFNWSVVAAPTPAWASGVFPQLESEEATEKLWDAVFRACRIDTDDPVAVWQNHLSDLEGRAEYLSGRQYRELRYRGPGTDLTMSLPEGCLWMGGGAATEAGRAFAPNIPTEEVFTSPHRLMVEGTVTATKPLSLFGNLIEGFSFTLEEGKIVAAEADEGQEVLDHLLATDEGSARFGEAAEGLVWNNTLYDENDACHIAIGRAYAVCLEDGTEMSAEEQEAAGLNQSGVHVDFVVGSDALDVMGVTGDGQEESIIAAGEWGFAV